MTGGGEERQGDGRKPFSISARLKSFVYAGNGIRLLVAGQHNAWIHLGMTALVILAAVLLGASRADWLWLVLAMAIVWIGEAVNSAIEALCDVVSPEFDAGIGRAKDLAAGAVLIAAIAAAIIGLLIFLPLISRSL